MKVLEGPIVQSPAMEPAPRRTRPCGVADRTPGTDKTRLRVRLKVSKDRRGTLRDKVPVLLCSIALPHLKGSINVLCIRLSVRRE